MASIRFEHVSKLYPGKVRAVQDFNLDIADREFVVLVGPSGCGKSTTLRLIAGLEDATEGTIRIGERVVNRVAPKDRDIAMVFQNYALYPHMTVYNNMAFGLKMRRVPRAEIKRKVHETAAMLGIGHLLEKKPAVLSGGERQRVAVGRAIVRKPAAFLFDEPLSNLDAQLRLHMRGELKRLHRELQTTAVYVTHDQEEALALGDRIVIMKDGIIQQIAPPMELHDRPANRFVASFIGTPQMNFLEGQIRAADGAVHFEMPDAHIRLSPMLADRAATRDGQKMILGTRPEHVMLSGASILSGVCAGCGAPRQGAFCHVCGRKHDSIGSTENFTAVEVRVEVIEPLGNVKDVRLRTNSGLLLVARVPVRSEIQTDQQLRAVLDPEHLHLFEPGPEGRNLAA
ncbi:MAG TPA: sn-glycerol-3-phosphate ABC transporter ATP-binding protein UgpC [Phycisphaerae bacterium]